MKETKEKLFAAKNMRGDHVDVSCGRNVWSVMNRGWIAGTVRWDHTSVWSADATIKADGYVLKEYSL